MGESLQDPALGTLAWVETCWHFEAGPIAGRSVRAFLIPEPGWDPLGEPSRSRVRACLDWVRANEPAIRSHIAAEMFVWWQDTCAFEGHEITTPQQFAGAIELEHVSFYSDGLARVVYDDRELVDGRGIWLTVGPNGEFPDGPEVNG